MLTKVVFFGSSQYSVIILQKLLEKFSVALVVTKTDKPSGRHQTVTPNPVAQFTLNRRLPLLQIDNFSPSVKLKIKKMSADIGLCVAFGPPYFDQEMLDIFPQGIVNIHPSPLPKYRGATPGPWQIINGETNSAVTFFQIDSLPDHGPIIVQIPFQIYSGDTSASFYQKAFSLAAANLDQMLLKSRRIQDESQKSYYPKLTKDSGKIDWSWPQDKINRFVNAMQPWPIAWTYVSDQNSRQLKMKIFSVQSVAGVLKPEKIQIEGKKPALWSEISSYYQL